MFGKFVTFIFIPKRTGKVKKTVLSVKVLLFLLVVVLVLLGLWSYVIYDYLSIRSRLINLKDNQSVYNTQQKRINSFYQQHESTEVHFKHVDSIYNKLKQLTQSTQLSQRRADEKSAAQQELKLKAAQESGILSVIASTISEIDADQQLKASRFDQLMLFFKETSSPLTRIPQGAPLKGYMISEFGVLQDSFNGRLRPRHGILIATRAFSPLFATADGVVRFAGPDKFYGEMILIDHANGIQSKYGYVSAISVKEGAIVRRGQQIAEIHNTQRTTGPQLYYEIDVNGIPLNPIKFINPLALKD